VLEVWPALLYTSDEDETQPHMVELMFAFDALSTSAYSLPQRLRYLLRHSPRLSVSCLGCPLVGLSGD
jgi:hypothetical protein